MGTPVPDPPPDSLAIDARARTALSALDPEARTAVVRAVAALAGTPPGEWPGQVFARPRGGESLRALPLPGGYLGFVQAGPGGRVELLDVMRHDTLRVFLERYRAAGRAG